MEITFLFWSILLADLVIDVMNHAEFHSASLDGSFHHKLAGLLLLGTFLGIFPKERGHLIC